MKRLALALLLLGCASDPPRQKSPEAPRKPSHAAHPHGHRHPHGSGGHHHHPHPHPHLDGQDGHHHPY